MALRAVMGHPKFAHLKGLLGLNKSCTLGYLEAIWHFTGSYAQQGNIGKYSDSEIESWVEWAGSPGHLIWALCESKWIDRDPTHRLIVHDWDQHADSATKKHLGRKGLTFVFADKDYVWTVSEQCPDVLPSCLDMSNQNGKVSGQCHDKQGQGQGQVSGPGAGIQNTLLPVPVSDASQPKLKAASDPWDRDEDFVGFWNNSFWPKYPRKDDRRPAMKALWSYYRMASNKGAFMESVMLALDLHMPALATSHDRGFCKHAKTWINSKPWDQDNLPFAPGIEPQIKRRIL